MNIGTMIKKYRNQRDLTQEQLSEYLNVSVSAVSQWESGKTVPDVSTLLSLANFFDVTLDELFNRTSKDKEKEIEEYCKLSREYATRGEVASRVALWREATQKYPGDFHCLKQLAYILGYTAYSGGHSDELEKKAKESITISCKSSMAMLRAIIHGTTDAEILSGFAEGKLIHKIPELRKALKGSIRFHQMQMLKLQMEHIDFLTKSIEEMDEDIKKKRNP